MAETAQYLKPALEAGTVLVPAAVTTARRLVGVVEEVVDGTDASISRRFSYAFVDQAGTVTDTGPAPYLDAVAAPTGPIVDAARRLPWLARDRLPLPMGSCAYVVRLRRLCHADPASRLVRRVLS